MSPPGAGRPDFGRYRLLHRVSVGGTAEIYKAKCFGERGFEKVVALKRLLPQAEENPELVRMFVHEAQLVAQLDHPRVARIYELGCVRGSHYIAMEYIYGRDLGELQQAAASLARPLGPAVAVAIGAMAAEALDYAHRFVDARGVPLRIVHRDVSPQNLMVTDEGELKLIDFGIARFAGREILTQAGVVKGKHAYMSPEQVRQRPLDGRSDLFSLGVILYELLTGTRLFKAESMLETMERVTSARVPPLREVDPSLPPALCDAVMHCLARDPAQRPARAADLASALLAIGEAIGEGAPRDVLQATYRELFGGEVVVEAEVSLDEYLEALRAVELGEDRALMAREASDITIVPDTTDLAAYVQSLRRHLRDSRARAASGAEPPGEAT